MFTLSNLRAGPQDRLQFISSVLGYFATSLDDGAVQAQWAGLIEHLLALASDSDVRECAILPRLMRWVRDELPVSAILGWEQGDVLMRTSSHCRAMLYQCRCAGAQTTRQSAFT